MKRSPRVKIEAGNGPRARRGQKPRRTTIVFHSRSKVHRVKRASIQAVAFVRALFVLGIAFLVVTLVRSCGQ